jgi:exodeoxyribonuclease V beta subunit
MSTKNIHEAAGSECAAGVRPASGRNGGEDGCQTPAFDPLAQDLCGAHSIEASAGTGKTYSITLLWLRLIVERNLRVDEILVTTFTNAATAELKDRLLASLRRAITAANGHADDSPEAKIVAQSTDKDLASRLESALSNFDLAPIYTIHGFCQSMISRQAIELGADPDVELVDQCDDILGQIVDDEQMRRAGSEIFDRATMLRVAKVVAGNPLGTIPPAIDGEALSARCEKMLAALVKQIEGLKMNKASLAAILRQIDEACASGEKPQFSSAQKSALGDLLAPLEAALKQVVALHKAAGAAAYYPLAGVIRREFPKRKSEANLRSYDDILLTVHRALKSPASPLAVEVRKRFRAAIVDECQDSDEIQIGIFKKLFLHRDVVSFLVIGDPKQSIYRFRGADLASYRALAGQAVQSPEMKTNHRSDKPLVDAINRIYEGREAFDECSAAATSGDAPQGTVGILSAPESTQVERPSSGETPHTHHTAAAPIRYIPVGAATREARIFDPRMDMPLVVQWSGHGDRAAARWDLADQLALECRRLLDENVEIAYAQSRERRRVRASDIAVLCSTNGDLSMVRQALQRRGVPCQQAGRGLGLVFESAEAMDVLAWLEALLAAERRADGLPGLLVFCATPLCGMPADKLPDIESDALAQAAHFDALSRELSDLRWHGPLPLLLRRIADELPRVLGHRDGERMLTNWRQLGVLLQNEWMAGRLSAGDLSRWLKRAMGRGGAGSDEHMMKLETDLPAVQLSTIHSSKGLEYPLVFCPFLWAVKSMAKRGRIPPAVLRTPSGTVLDLGSEKFAAHIASALKQEDEEQQRLLYVALTRARHRVYLGLAPVDEGRGNHANGAEKSELAKLLGLSEIEKSRWLERLNELALIPPTTGGPAPSESAPAEPQASALAEPPELPDVRRWPNLRCTSYSSLARSAHEEESLPVRDRDEDALQDVPASRDGLLGGLGSGNTLGTEVHRILEEILGNGKPPKEVLASLPDWRKPVDTILSTPLKLGGNTIRLTEVKRLAEMHFLIPANGRFSPAALSDALLADPLIAGDPARNEWARGLAGWSFAALHGYLQGYMDLVFEHRGRWYVADYKSNRLVGYAPAQLEGAMLGSAYLLQSRLYTVALHRHLRRNLAGYSYADHVGGSAWLFLRGFPDHGVWFECPDEMAVETLDRLFL